MRLKDTFILYDPADSTLMVPLQPADGMLNYVVHMNQTGKEMVQILMNKDVSRSELIEILEQNYNVSRSMLEQDVDKLIQKLTELHTFVE